ncbi:MAG TPA: sigma factor [Syntrophomonadaceae bacterium]|nr:sigma factor [Syntrophomonadaceae bacterium]HPR93228.1 sigma factor [Syntrophomonadaceae bacterium]
MSGSDSHKLEKVVYKSWQNYHAGNTGAIEEIYPELMPFCLRICSRTCGRYIDDSEEEASIARMSIIEAFDRYEPDKGHILVYLGRVIHNRIIDYKRSEKLNHTLPLEDFDLGQIADDQIGDLVDEMARIQEIEQFKLTLNSFDIEFAELVTASPRQNKTRDMAKKICIIIAADEKLQSYLLEKRKLPIKQLEEEHQINRKLIDRYRKYIIAGALILIYDFAQLKSYIWPGKGGTDRD